MHIKVRTIDGQEFDAQIEEVRVFHGGKAWLTHDGMCGLDFHESYIREHFPDGMVLCNDAKGGE